MEDSYWRDLLAITGTFRTFCASQNILRAWNELTAQHQLYDLCLVGSSLRPNPILPFVSATFTFGLGTSPAKKCSGILRLVPVAGGSWRIWILSTILEEIHGLEILTFSHYAPRNQQRNTLHLSLPSLRGMTIPKPGRPIHSIVSSLAPA